MGQAVPTMVRLAAAVDAFPAFALTGLGRGRGRLTLAALAPYLPRYQRSLAVYARPVGYSLNWFCPGNYKQRQR